MSKFLEVRANGNCRTLKIHPLPCGWLEVVELGGGRVHQCPDEEAVRLFLIENLHWQILREYEAEDT